MKTKTNAMRRLDAAKIPYEVFEYPVDENDLSGKHIADEIGLPVSQTGGVLPCGASARWTKS